MQLTEAQRMIYATARKFAEREIKPHIRERAHETFPIDIMRKLAENGLLAAFPKCTAARASTTSPTSLARRSAAPAVRFHGRSHRPVLACLHRGPLLRLRGPEAPLPAGHLRRPKIGAFALSEPNVGSDPAAGELTAKRNGDDWVLSGSKFWISNGSVADYIVVFAQTDPGTRHKGMAAFLVDGDSAGLERQVIHDKLGLHASNTAALFFDGVHVPGDRLLGKTGDGFKIAQTSLESGRTSRRPPPSASSRPASTPASPTPRGACSGASPSPATS
jgi:alkylation response protein AidB-like acyl-CoA dehydrogenase